MKAEDIAPSPTISRSMFGIRKATKNASDRVPAPRRRAITLSRAYPVTRETRVSGVMTEAERTIRPRLSCVDSDDIRSGDDNELSVISCQLSVFGPGPASCTSL